MLRGILIFILATIIFLFGAECFAQSYINFSTLTGSSGFDDVKNIEVVNGQTYVVGSTDSPDFPSTNGSSFTGSADLTVTKYDVNGSIIYSTFLGGIGAENLNAMQVINGEVFILGIADSLGYPVTNGSSFRGKTDIILTKLQANGSIAFSTYIGGSRGDFPTNQLYIAGNEIIIGGFTESADFPVTTGSYNGGSRDGFLMKINATNGTIIQSVYIGGSLEDSFTKVLVEGNFIYLTGGGNSLDMPVTIFSTPATVRSLYVFKCEFSTLNIAYGRYLGGSFSQQLIDAQVINGILHICGFTQSNNFPVTNGTAFSSFPNDFSDGFFSKIDQSGSLIFSTYLNSDGVDFISSMAISQGTVYIAGVSNSLTVSQQRDLAIFKINANNSFGYLKKIRMGNTVLPFSMIPVDDELYVSGITNAPEFPVTNGGQYFNGGTGYFVKVDGSGNTAFAGFLGKMNTLLPIQFANNQFYLLGQTDLNSYPVTDSSLPKGAFDNIIFILNRNGAGNFGTYIGGLSNESPSQLRVSGNDIFISGRSSSTDYPVSNASTFRGIEDIFLTRISFCPNNFDTANDNLTPSLQSVCRFGLAESITGIAITVPADSLPILFTNGTAHPQSPIEARYQWQVSNTAAGPWTDIPGAVFKDYRPAVGANNLFYRRLALSPAECGTSVIHTSEVAVVNVNSLTAPTINIINPYVTCPGSSIAIGGSPTVSGGNPPYVNYEWDNGADAVSNPVVSPPNSTLYTLIVTDAAGCKNIGQALVTVIRADAGPDKNNCANEPVLIGTPAPPGISGVSYNWQPASSLTGTNIAQPLANPPVPSDYILTLTVTKSDGNSCVSSDTVRIAPVAPPVTPNFAGPDRTVCLKTNTTLGTAPEPGFSYVWSPGSYLTSNTTSTTTYVSGNLLMPVPNPATINLTASKEGCSFTDQVVVTTIESRAGLLACGPRLVGLPDRTPNINETYAWNLQSGPGNFTGAVNLPQVPVSASNGATSIYRLQVSFNGTTCSSTVEVPDSCIGCNTRIIAEAQYGCPGFGVNGGVVTLRAFTNLQNPVFTWSPQVGLSAYTGNTVQLTDNVPRTYSVTAVDINDTTQRCSGEIFVNDPAFSIPVFTAPDVTICANTPTPVGVAPVAGYSYQWTGTGLSNNFISNPLANIPFDRTYTIRVTDANGCQLNDTVLVQVQNVAANAGSDWQVCSNAVVQLGTLAQPNTSYLWEPQASAWQNGTGATSAQPEVLVAANVSFILTASTSAGCISRDTVNVFIDDFPSIPALNDTVACLNQPILIGSQALPGVIYQWSPATGLSNPNIAQPLASPSVNTTYDLLAIFPGSCATQATEQLTVTVSDASFNMPDISFCPGNGPVQLGANAPVNAGSYAWSPASLVTDSAIVNPSTLTPPPVVATVFTLTATNADGCAFTDTLQLNPIVAAPDAGPDRTLCNNQSVTIGSNTNPVLPNLQYQWIPAVNLSDPNDPNPVFTAATGGIYAYTLIKTDILLNCSVSDTVWVTVIDSLIPPFGSPVACRNACVQFVISAVPGVQYQWSPAAGLSNPHIANPVICVDSNTVSYTLTANDVNGCSSSATVVVTVSNLQAPQVSVPPVNACIGDANVQFAPVITPAGSYSYAWTPDNGTLNDVNILNPQVIIGGAGTYPYSLLVTDNGNGCTNIGNTVVNVQPCNPLAIVGDYMWFDTDLDGLQDPGEPGASGQLVTLYNSSNFAVGTTVTDINGQYLFNNVPPGNDYYVVFTRPADFSFTLQNVGGAAQTNNSKPDTSGCSTNFNVPPGGTVLNIDAGLIPDACVVPVTLLSFTGRLMNETVLLNWQTSAEINNEYFEVERSTDGTLFNAIGRVPGHGTTALPHAYSLLDREPVYGINYYRLKQVDIDNNFAYSHIVPLQLNEKDLIAVYYNEINNSIVVQFRKLQEKVLCRLFASNGQLVKSTNFSNNQQIIVPLPLLAKGIYLLNLQFGDESVTTKLLLGK